MKRKLAFILVISLTLAVAAPAAGAAGFAAEQNQPAAEIDSLEGELDPSGDSDLSGDGEEPTTTSEPETTTEPTTTMEPTAVSELKKDLDQAITSEETTTTKAATTTKTTTTTKATTTKAPKPKATVKTKLKSVTVQYSKSYKKTLKDTISVSPAYGRTVKLYFYDSYKCKWVLKKTYKTSLKKTAKVKIKYPALWKAYSFSKWKIVCPEHKSYKAASKVVTINNKIVNAKAAIIMDGKTGEVLYAKNARKHLKIASMTKMVTMMLVDDLAKDKTKVTITSEAVEAKKMSSGMGLVKGDVVYMKDLEHATLMESANDAAAAAACGVSGTQDQFAVLMVEKAKRLGATETTFQYAFGDWHCKTHSTAYDQALIGREFMINPKYDNLRAIVKKGSYSFTTLKKKKKYTVKMGAMSTALIKNGKSIGIKSGYNPPAGYCYANAWKYNGRTYISIVMGASSQKKLISSQKALMKYGEFSVKYNGYRIKVK